MEEVAAGAEGRRLTLWRAGGADGVHSAAPSRRARDHDARRRLGEECAQPLRSSLTSRPRAQGGWTVGRLWTAARRASRAARRAPLLAAASASAGTKLSPRRPSCIEEVLAAAAAAAVVARSRAAALASVEAAASQRATLGCGRARRH